MRDDTLRKAQEYAAAGIGQYWIVDPQNPNPDGPCRQRRGWNVSLELDADHPRGEVTVADNGAVVLDLPELLAR